MPQNQKIVRRRRRKSHRAPIFVMLALILLLIGAIATTFSFYVIDDLQTETNPYATPVGDVVFGGVDFTAIPKVMGLGESLEGTSVMYRPKAVGTSSAEEGEKPTENVKAVTVVPETAAAPEGYFDDALFIGDSISEGIKNSGAIPAKQIIANKNVGLNAVAGGQAVYYTKGTEPKTLFQAIEELNPNPGKFYILLGANGMPGFDNETHIKFYYQLIDQLKEAYPDAIIYAESVTPMAKVSDYSKKFTQEKINGFNDLIRKMAEEESIYYLDVQSVLKDSEGYLTADYAPSDGLHMVRKAHDLMFHYYQHHVVLEDGTMDKVIGD